MRITIDNLDGLGPLDYTGAIAAQGPITLQRALNVPSRCTMDVLLGVGGLALPVRRARVVVTAEDAATTLLFTGYIATEPVRLYVGEAVSGPAYRARVSAVSDEWLLDKLGSGAGTTRGPSFSIDGRTLVSRLTESVQAGGPASLTVASGPAVPNVGTFGVQASSPWSVNAGAASSAAYAGYRALGGQLFVHPAASAIHAFSDADGTLSIAELATSAVRELANDVTVSGMEEPAAYITGSFAGDGTTAIFNLSEAAYRSSVRSLLKDSFNAATLDTTQWLLSDPGGHLSLTSLGLTLNGGTGVDGATALSAVDAIELGGTVLIELAGVMFGAASDGMLGGIYSGATVLANCIAGFRVRQQSGVSVLVPVIDGAETGTVFTPVAGHSYTLRLRLYSVEMQRVQQRFYCMVDGIVESFGSASGITAPLNVVFDLVDEGAASNTPATVLWDSAATTGPLLNTAATCTFVAANSTQLFGSIASVNVTQPGSLWVVSTLPGGTLQTRIIGAAGSGADCTATYGSAAGTPGRVTFYAGRVPVAGERISVTYRGEQRSVARLQDAASVAAEAAGGASGTCRWLGKVLQPMARSSVDCESAAEAILAFATSRTAAVAGKYACFNPQADIWPGDVLSVTSAGVTSSFLVRKVVVEDGGSVPEVRNYRIAFANDWATEWADGLGLRLSEDIAADAILPQTALSSPGQVLANLQQLSLTSVTETALQVDAGTAPPAGGGFEVRRRDWNFGVGVDAADLVLRSSVRSFTIPRAAQVERYYVRMYDAGTPTLYSRFSSAVFVNWPV